MGDRYQSGQNLQNEKFESQDEHVFVGVSNTSSWLLFVLDKASEWLQFAGNFRSLRFVLVLIVTRPCLGAKGLHQSVRFGLLGSSDEQPAKW